MNAGSTLLPSAVCAQEDGSLLVGRDALRAARIRPECFEPHPKKRVDDGRVLLGAHEVRVEDLVGAVLGRVFRAAAELTGGERPRRVTLTHPAGWGRLRQDVLRAAAGRAGAAEVDLVAEPVAAGTHLVRHDVGVRPGARVLVYDLGGGTFDASVIRCDEHLTVLASAGLPDAGGLDIDQAEAAALNRQLREHGDGHPLRLAAADAYCQLRTRQARAVPAGPARADEVRAIHADAVRIARAALGKHRDLNGDTHPRTVLARFRFGDCLIEAGDPATGIAELRAALRTADEVMGRDRPRTWQLRLELAARRTGGGDTDEAEQIYRDAAAALPRLLGDDSLLAAKARDRLAHVAQRNATLSHRIKRRLRGLAEQPDVTG
ncbi:Hsp70 family protein [Dactylosporangium sp. NPDC049742]|uniref:Hsp70 family protein n=1 Tax=Dactylosporangium sp. NPDC049742 TaxID=3154737 RepID=UPI00343172BA